MPRPINEEKLVAKMTKAFIIPNWYQPHNFAQSEDWDKAKVERFKQWFSKSLCAYDPFYAMVSEYMKEFEDAEDDYLCSACHRDYQTINCENPCDCICDDGEPILRKDYCQLCLVDIENEGVTKPEDCPHCVYPDKKWSYGSCKKCDDYLYLDENEFCMSCYQEEQRTCFYCNIPINRNTACGDCNIKRIDKGLDPI
jgi:hypothetical protein